MKTRSILSIISCAAVVLSSSLASGGLSRDQRISDAEALIALFKHRYAPIEWKKNYLGISVDDLAAELMGEAYRNDATDEDFYAAMAKVAGGVHDTHIWFLIPSSYSAHLGFICDYVEGRVLIDYVNRLRLPENTFPFFRGDELISIGGTPVEDLMAELGEYSSEGNILSEKRFLAMEITNRYQQTYPYIPTGTVEVEIFSQERGKVENASLEWYTMGRPLGETLKPEAFTSDAEISAVESAVGDAQDAYEDLENLRWSAIREEKAIEARIGDSKPFFPLWDSFNKRTDSPLFSGTFKLDGKRIGFIRIPTWWPASSGPWFYFFANEIPYLEKNTDALVIDQTNNGGGNLCLANDVASFLVSQPISNLQFQIRANRKRLSMYEEWERECVGSGSKNKPAECPIVAIIAAELRRALADGDALTKPLPLCVDDGKIHPATDKNGKRYVYTKPILLIVNEWSISAADMFPATLQDGGRVTVFGERTCGAGGSVMTSEHMGFTDFRVSQTETLAVRSKEVISVDGIATRYLENVGVIPDITYSITTEDFLSDYEGYRNAIDDAIRKIAR